MALPTPEVTEITPEVERARAAAARRAAARAAPPAAPAAPTAAVAPAAPEAAKSSGWFRRTANALRSGATAAGEAATATPGKLAALPGQIVNADLGAAASGALRVGGTAAKAAGGMLTGPTARMATPIAAIGSAVGSYGTDTDTYAQRTGIDRGASDWTGKGADAGSRLRFDAVKDAGIRALGTAQDLGNTLTFGLADRVGNALAGNGFNRSAGNQVGEWFGRGSEVGDDQPPPTAPAPSAAGAAAQPSSADAADMAMRRGAGRDAAPPPTATASGPSTPSGQITYDAKTKTYSDGSDSGAIPGKDGSYRAQGGLIRDQAPTVNADGSITPGTLRGSGQVSTVSTSEGYQSDLRELARLKSERAEREAGYAGNQPGGGLSGFGGATLSSALREKVEREKTPSMNGLSAQQAVAAQQGQRQLAQGLDLAQMQNATAQAGQANQLRTAEMNSATLRENNANTARANLRGHELDFERGMIPLKMLQQRMATQQKYLDATKGPDGKGQADPAAAHADMVRDGVGYAAEDLAKGVTTQLDQEKASGSIKTERAARTRALFNGRGGSLIDPDLKDEAKTGALKAAEDDAHSFARQTVKGFDDMHPDEQRALMPKIMGLYELHQKTKNPDHTGNLAWARNLISPQDNSGPANSLREQGFYKGGKVGDRFGALSGALTGGYEKGDVDFNPSGGKNSLRIANPSDNALEVLRRLTQGKDPLGED